MTDLQHRSIAQRYATKLSFGFAQPPLDGLFREPRRLVCERRRRRTVTDRDRVARTYRSGFLHRKHIPTAEKSELELRRGMLLQVLQTLPSGLDQTARF